MPPMIARSGRWLLLFSFAAALLLPARSLAQNTIYVPLVRSTSAVSATTPVSSPAAEVQAAGNYWTRERMAKAKSVDLLAMTGIPPATTLVPQATGPAQAVRGRLPDADADGLARTLYPRDWVSQVETQEADAEAVTTETTRTAAVTAADYYSYPPPFTRYTVNQYTQLWKEYPWRTVGRVFSTIPGQGDVSCTGAVAVGRAVWTAGHCLYTPGVGWHTAVTFVPAYRNGAAPYGIFTVKQSFSLNGWVNSGDWAYDIGMIVTNDIKNKKVSQWVGALGAMWNQPVSQHFHSFGYPVGLLEGKYLLSCVASTSRTDTNYNPATPGMGCDMLGGSSGGPWLIKFAPYTAGAVNYVNGVQSHYYSAQPLELFSPYFGDGAAGLYNLVKDL